MGNKIVMEINEEKLVAHVKRICCSNIRRPAKICLECPFVETVLRVMKENGWKLPSAEILKEIKKRA